MSRRTEELALLRLLLGAALTVIGGAGAYLFSTADAAVRVRAASVGFLLFAAIALVFGGAILRILGEGEDKR